MIYEKLTELQKLAKIPKDKYNSFGKYSYRSFEGMCEAIKPILSELGLSLYFYDELENIGDRYYVKAVGVLTDGNGKIMFSALAREEETKKGMDGSQITGTASSYARKYALAGLLLADDTKDADTDEFARQTESKAAPEARKKAVWAKLVNMMSKSEAVNWLKDRGIAYDTMTDDQATACLSELTHES